MPRGGGGASHGTLVPLHLPLLGFCFFFCVCVCCITNLYCISLEEHPIKLWKKKIPTISMVLKGPHKTTEVATKDTEMG